MENEETQVSILIPVYKVEKYIARCARSLFEQTYQNLEFIFINDCTPDNSIGILEEVLIKYPNRKGQVKIIKHTENKGVSVVRNTGIDAATGQYVMWVDSDDYIEFNTVKLMVTEATQTGGDIISCGFCTHFKHYTKNTLNPIWSSKDQMLQSLLERKVPVCLWSRLIRTSLYKEKNIKCVPGINDGEDFLVMAQLSYFANKVSTCQKILFHYDRTNENSCSNNVSEGSIKSLCDCIHYLIVFFEKYGENEKIISVRKGEATQIILIIKRIIKNNFQTSAVKDLLSKIYSFNPKYLTDVPAFDKPIIHIQNIIILKFYIKFMVFCKKNISILKYIFFNN